jgi:HD-GYP domain-containing protein (c-di-GMP phosphodiesterase class II)
VADVAQAEKNLGAIFRMKASTRERVHEFIRDQKSLLNRYIASNGMAETITRLLEDLTSQPSIVANLSAMEEKSPSLLSHGLRVTVMAVCIGRKYGFDYTELKQLATGALLADIGMIALPAELVGSTQMLEEEQRKLLAQHTVYGYLMLSQNNRILPTSAAIALQHHEHQDGTGYPRGLPGDNRPPTKSLCKSGLVHRFAEIVAVADTYDMLTYGRTPYGVKVGQRKAMEMLYELAGVKLNADIVRTLARITPVYPKGVRIKVSAAPVADLVGYFGVVARDNPLDLTKPTVLLYETRKHQKIKPLLIELGKVNGVAIEVVV